MDGRGRAEPATRPTLAPHIDGAPLPEKSAGPLQLPPAAARVIALQKQAGNAAVSSLVLQRQSAKGADVELDALIAQITRSMPKTPPVPTFEAITATTSGEYSRGELETEIGRLWRRERLGFTEAARRTARADRSGPRAAQSPETAAPSGGYGLRWGLGLYAANYRRWGDLPEVAALMRRGSPLGQAMRQDFSRVVTVRDPTGAVIGGSVRGAVIDLWAALPEGTIGQLVVFFSGHGGAGTVYGVDETPVTPAQFLELSRFAADFNVHVVYVLDTCRAGKLAQLAQLAAYDAAERRLGKLPPAERAQGAPLVRFAIAFWNRTSELGQLTIDLGDVAKEYARRSTDARKLEMFQALLAMSSGNRNVRELLQPGQVPGSLPRAAAVLASVEDLSWALLAAMSLGPRPADAVLRRVAIILDDAGDLLNDVTERLDRQVRSGSPAR